MPPDDSGPLLPIAVYGSLRPGGEGYRRFDLDKHAIPMGPCRIAGRLVTIDDYPALIGGDGTVDGVLLAIDNADLLTRIDAWEGEGYRRSRTRLYEPNIAAWVWHWVGEVPDYDDAAGKIVSGIIDIIDISFS
jgi:gamma-glutamylcyclotransferase (GGCT)/AIG2-like uncharacterized protein YtfP